MQIQGSYLILLSTFFYEKDPVTLKLYSESLIIENYDDSIIKIPASYETWYEFRKAQQDWFVLIMHSPEKHYKLFTPPQNYEKWDNALLKYFPKGNFGNWFNLISELGYGQYTNLSYGSNTYNLKKYAVKTIKTNIFIYPSKQKQTLLNEATILKKVEHPSICEYYGIGLSGSHWNLLHEYVNGINLKEVLFRYPGIHKSVCKKIMKNILETIAFIHTKNVLHNDIHPGNIIVMTNATIKIINFGFATDLDHLDTIIHFKPGTIGYMAPQLLSIPSGHQTLIMSEKTEIYSLGVLFYELVFKKPAFDLQNLPQKYIANKNNLFALPCTEIDPQQVGIIRAMMNTDPDRRPSIKEVLKSPYFKTDDDKQIKNWKLRCASVKTRQSSKKKPNKQEKS